MLQTPAAADKKRKYDTFTPEEQASFQDLFVSCLKKQEVVDIFKGIITDCIKDQKIRELEERVYTLERRLEESEQYSRRTCLKISGVPEQQNENTDNVIVDLARAMNVDIKSEDLSRSHRLPTRNKRKKDRDLVVRFVTYNKRNDFLIARKKLSNVQRFKNVYVNEHLSQQRQELFFKCRKYVKDKTILGTWTRDGRIAVKYDVGGVEVVKWVTHIDELDKIIHPPADDLEASFMA